MESPYRCPDCAQTFAGPTALAEHAVTAHVQASTPGAHIRRPRMSALMGGIVTGLGIAAGLAFWGIMIYGFAEGFEKEAVPVTTSSIAHKVATDLRSSGEIEEFQAVEPSDDWDVEYELDRDAGSSDFGIPDGVIRARDEGTAFRQVEYEAYEDDLYTAIEAALRERGFQVEEQ